MYRMSLMSFLIPQESQIDRIKCMKLALIHDLAESIVGDITPYCGISKQEKRLREHKAFTEICSLLDDSTAQELFKLFDEYESQATPEALLVKDFDLYDMLLQVINISYLVIFYYLILIFSMSFPGFWIRKTRSST